MVRWLKLNVPAQKSQSTVSWYVRRNCAPKLKVWRPLFHSQLLADHDPEHAVVDYGKSARTAFKIGSPVDSPGSRRVLTIEGDQRKCGAAGYAAKTGVRIRIVLTDDVANPIRSGRDHEIRINGLNIVQQES